MNHRNIALLVVLGALAALGVAYAAQYVQGLYPCPLCLWERWPYRLVAGFGFLAILSRPATGRLFLVLAAVGLVAAAGLAALHVGVEQHWWASPLPECNGFITPGAPLPMTPAKPCDQPSYLVPGIGVSMAVMNFIYAVAFALTVLSYVARRPRRFR